MYDVWGYIYAVACVQRSENNSMELVLSSDPHVGSQVDLRSSGLEANSFAILPAQEPYCFPQLNVINLCNTGRNPAVPMSAHLGTETMSVNQVRERPTRLSAGTGSSEANAAGPCL